jgi:tetratricopeptide (TPR) repeat protein
MADTLTDLSKEAKQYWANEKWGEYRNVRYETAEHVRGQDQRRRAAYLYVEVMIFDLQGVASGIGGEGFNVAYRGETPSVARELARYSLHENIGESALKVIFDQVADEFWVEAFPRSRSEVWDEMRSTVREYKEIIQLREQVESLGPDQLLSPDDATSFAELADDYELLQRVETLLEDESPTDVPWEKRKRAHDYLSAVDIKSLGDRWKGKAFRWAGEVVLSNGEKQAALDYFEKALEVVGRDEKAAVKRLARTLRRELDRQAT